MTHNHNKDDDKIHNGTKQKAISKTIFKHT